MTRTPRIANVFLVLSALIAVALPAQAEPAIWVVKSSHATVYLFGTIHALQQDHPWQSPKIDSAIKNSDTLWLDIPDIDDPSYMQPLILQLGMDPSNPLSSKLTADQVTKLKKAESGLPGGEALLEPMKPWLAG